MLEVLRKEKLFAKESKCELFKAEVEFLGHFVGGDGVRMMQARSKPRRVACAHQGWPRARVPRYGGYYRKFIKDFSSIAAPFSIYQGLVKFDWTSSCQSIRPPQGCAARWPVLVLPDP